MHTNRGILFGCCLAIAVSLYAAGAQQEAPRKVRVVIVDGQNNHDWRSTTPFMKRVLEESGRFEVDVSSYLRPGDKPGRVPTIPFPPDLSKYDVVLSNYNGGPWPAEFQKEFESRLREGKIGLVIVHAANNAFGNWQEYNRMIGLGWRNPKQGDRIYLNDKGELVRLPSGKGDGSGHRYTGEFTVVIRDADHPITRGLPREWRHTRDELYDNLRGPAENLHILATAFSKGTGVHEPIVWTVSYGQGRVFHTPLGHDLNGMRCIGFITILRRGTEWAATGQVTIPVPDNFPTADKTSAVKD
ncbi:MAG: ThuA domain-containing protein [Gemmatales bacterium]|nr:ThuA domain-containing protein [Gemmatales bacterium]MDW7994914.1 ThuA domain-containing protein [Gemmatales bacterium]